MRSRTSRALARAPSIRPALTLVDPLAVVLAAWLALPHLEPGPVAVAALAAVLVGRGAGLHRSRLVLSVLEDLPALLLSAVVVTWVLGGLSPTVDLGVGTLGDAALFGLLSFAGMVLLRTALYALTHVLRRAGAITHPVVIVGAGVVGRRLAESLLVRRELGLVPVGMLDAGAHAGSRGLPLPLLGGVDDLDQVLRDLGVDDVIFAFPAQPDHDTVAAVRRSVLRGRQVFVVPRFFELVGHDRHRRTEMVRDIAVVRLHRRETGWSPRLVRRAVDVVVALGGLLVLAPALLLVAVAVRLETGPGVLVRQTRVGEGGRTFALLSFRSLRPVAFGVDATTWRIDNDSRIGPVGRLLRRTGLDELPQLVNVLRGEMSLVGPRPERPDLVEVLSRDRGRHAERHGVPVGLTGWAALDELLGDPEDDGRYDAGRRSLWQDVTVAARRVRTSVRRGTGRDGNRSADVPPTTIDDLTSAHWSWREDLRLALQALRGTVTRGRGEPPPDLTPGAGSPPAGGRPATGRELHAARRG